MLVAIRDYSYKLEARLKKTELSLNRQRVKLNFTKKQSEHATQKVKELQQAVEAFETHLDDKAEELQTAVSDLKYELNEAEIDRDKLHQHVTDLEANTI